MDRVNGITRMPSSNNNNDNNLNLLLHLHLIWFKLDSSFFDLQEGIFVCGTKTRKLIYLINFIQTVKYCATG